MIDRSILDGPRVRRVLRRWGWLLAIAAVAGGATAYVASDRAPLRSEATATLLIGPPEGEEYDYQSILAFERLAQTYTNMAAMEPVLRRAIDEGALPLTTRELAPLLLVRNPPGTQFLTVRVVHGNSDLAARIANSVAAAFSTEAAAGPDGQARIVTLLDPAAPTPAEQVPPGPSVSALFGASLGFLLSAGGVLLLDAGSRAIASAEEARQIIQRPMLGHVGRLPRGSRRSLLARVAANEEGAGSWFRFLRTHVATHLTDSNNALVVTSAAPGDGKTTTVIGLAAALALAGFRVCIVDGDVRRPSVHGAFRLDPSPGIADLVEGAATEWRELVRETEFANLSVVPAGARGQAELELTVDRMVSRLIIPLKGAFDVVLVDAPPVLVGAEVRALCAGVGRTLLVVREDRTPADALQTAVDDLNRSGTRILGFVQMDAVLT
ncbi:MAG: AAA family ATPase [Dehalococcoidia bacterium]